VKGHSDYVKLNLLLVLFFIFIYFLLLFAVVTAVKWFGQEVSLLLLERILISNLSSTRGLRPSPFGGKNGMIFFFWKTTSHNSLLQLIWYISLFLSLLNSSLSLNIGMSILVSSSVSIMNESIFLPCGNSDWSNQLPRRPLFSF